MSSAPQITAIRHAAFYWYRHVLPSWVRVVLLPGHIEALVVALAQSLGAEIEETTDG